MDVKKIVMLVVLISFLVQLGYSGLVDDNSVIPVRDREIPRIPCIQPYECGGEAPKETDILLIVNNPNTINTNISVFLYTYDESFHKVGVSHAPVFVKQTCDDGSVRYCRLITGVDGTAVFDFRSNSCSNCTGILFVYCPGNLTDPEILGSCIGVEDISTIPMCSGGRSAPSGSEVFYGNLTYTSNQVRVCEERPFTLSAVVCFPGLIALALLLSTMYMTGYNPLNLIRIRPPNAPISDTYRVKPHGASFSMSAVVSTIGGAIYGAIKGGSGKSGDESGGGGQGGSGAGGGPPTIQALTDLGMSENTAKTVSRISGFVGKVKRVKMVVQQAPTKLLGKMGRAVGGRRLEGILVGAASRGMFTSTEEIDSYINAFASGTGGGIVGGGGATNLYLASKGITSPGVGAGFGGKLNPLSSFSSDLQTAMYLMFRSTFMGIVSHATGGTASAVWLDFRLFSFISSNLSKFWRKIFHLGEYRRLSEGAQRLVSGLSQDVIREVDIKKISKGSDGRTEIAFEIKKKDGTTETVKINDLDLAPMMRILNNLKKDLSKEISKNTDGDKNIREVNMLKRIDYLLNSLNIISSQLITLSQFDVVKVQETLKFIKEDSYVINMKEAYKKFINSKTKKEKEKNYKKYLDARKKVMARLANQYNIQVSSPILEKMTDELARDSLTADKMFTYIKSYRDSLGILFAFGLTAYSNVLTDMSIYHQLSDIKYDKFVKQYKKEFKQELKRTEEEFKGAEGEIRTSEGEIKKITATEVAQERFISEKMPELTEQLEDAVELHNPDMIHTVLMRIKAVYAAAGRDIDLSQTQTFNEVFLSRSESYLNQFELAQSTASLGMVNSTQKIYQTATENYTYTSNLLSWIDLPENEDPLAFKTWMDRTSRILNDTGQFLNDRMTTYDSAVNIYLTSIDPHLMAGETDWDNKVAEDLTNLAELQPDVISDFEFKPLQMSWFTGEDHSSDELVQFGYNTSQNLIELKNQYLEDTAKYYAVDNMNKGLKEYEQFAADENRPEYVLKDTSLWDSENNQLKHIDMLSEYQEELKKNKKQEDKLLTEYMYVMVDWEDWYKEREDIRSKIEQGEIIAEQGKPKTIDELKEMTQEKTSGWENQLRESYGEVKDADTRIDFSYTLTKTYYDAVRTSHDAGQNKVYDKGEYDLYKRYTKHVDEQIREVDMTAPIITSYTQTWSNLKRELQSSYSDYTRAIRSNDEKRADYLDYLEISDKRVKDVTEFVISAEEKGIPEEDIFTYDSTISLGLARDPFNQDKYGEGRYLLNNKQYRNYKKRVDSVITTGGDDDDKEWMMSITSMNIVVNSTAGQYNYMNGLLKISKDRLPPSKLEKLRRNVNKIRSALRKQIKVLRELAGSPKKTPKMNKNKET